MRKLCMIAVLSVLALPIGAAPPHAADMQRIGPVTQQPLPRWVSMKVAEANARRGPSMNHRVDWVFRHRNMPLLVTAEHGHWRRVEDRDGVGGWVHYVMLSRARTAIVDEDRLPIRRKPDAAAPEVAEAQKGAVVYLKDCKAGWCQVASGRLRGWAPQAALWGATDTPGG